MRALLLSLLLAAGVPAHSASDALVLRLNAFAASHARFAVTYREFAASYNAGVLDVRVQQELSREMSEVERAWRQVETSGEWPHSK